VSKARTFNAWSRCNDTFEVLLGANALVRARPDPCMR
jgi:hypothetical protein